MFGLFKKKENGQKSSLPQLLDLDDQPLVEGDKVESLRYGLGNCLLKLEDGKYYYESLESGEKVIWLKMVDAITERQKVRKIVDN